MVGVWPPRPKIFLNAEVGAGMLEGAMGGCGARASETVAEAARATTSRFSRVSLVAASSWGVVSFTTGSGSGSAGAATSVSASDGLLSSTSTPPGWSQSQQCRRQNGMVLK